MNQHYATTFSTFDLALAAYLQTRGYILESLDRSDPRKVAFIFTRGEDMDQSIREFWNRRQSVEPTAYFDAIKHLKSQIYSR